MNLQSSQHLVIDLPQTPPVLPQAYDTALAFEISERLPKGIAIASANLQSARQLMLFQWSVALLFKKLLNALFNRLHT
jgi:hypothetical protein